MTGDSDKCNMHQIDVPKIVPNFRRLDNGSNVIYRSSCIDYVPDDNIEKFIDLGVETIIDLRDHVEYKRTSGRKLIDKSFSLVNVKLGFSERFESGEDLKYAKIATRPSEQCQNSRRSRYNKEHIFISLFSPYFLWSVFRRTTFTMMLFSIFYIVIDLFKCNWGFPHVVQYFSKTLNQSGLIGQYKNMIDYSKKSICAALKIIALRGDRPLILCCAFGKDRTSVVAALIQSCISVSDAEIAHCYGLNTELLVPLRPHMRRNLMGAYGLSEDFILSKEETMFELLDYIRDNYGSVCDYMTQIGFGPPEQAQLRRHFGVVNDDE